MKSTIKYLAIGVLFFTFSFAAQAQRGGGQQLAPEDMAEKQTTQMTKELGLDETQAAKIKELNLDYAQRLHEAQEENKGNREAMKIIKDAINSEKSTEMKTVLTEEQYKKYQQMQTETSTRKGRKGGGGGRRG